MHCRLQFVPLDGTSLSTVWCTWKYGIHVCLEGDSWDYILEGQKFCAGPKTPGFSCLLVCQPSWPAIDKALFFETRNASRLPPDPREPRGPTHDC